MFDTEYLMSIVYPMFGGGGGGGGSLIYIKRSEETVTGSLIVDRFMSVVTIQEKQFEGAYSFIDEYGYEPPYDEDDVCKEIYGIPEQFAFDLQPSISQVNKLYEFFGVTIFNEGIGAFEYYMKEQNNDPTGATGNTSRLFYTAYGMPWSSGNGRHFNHKSRRLVIKNDDGANLVVL